MTLRIAALPLFALLGVALAADKACYVRVVSVVPASPITVVMSSGESDWKAASYTLLDAAPFGTASKFVEFSNCSEWKITATLRGHSKTYSGKSVCPPPAKGCQTSSLYISNDTLVQAPTPSSNTKGGNINLVNLAPKSVVFFQSFDDQYGTEFGNFSASYPLEMLTNSVLLSRMNVKHEWNVTLTPPVKRAGNRYTVVAYDNGTGLTTVAFFVTVKHMATKIETSFIEPFIAWGIFVAITLFGVIMWILIELRRKMTQKSMEEEEEEGDEFDKVKAVSSTQDDDNI